MVGCLGSATPAPHVTAPSHPSGTLAEYKARKRVILVPEEEEEEESDTTPPPTGCRHTPGSHGPATPAPHVTAPSHPSGTLAEDKGNKRVILVPAEEEEEESDTTDTTSPPMGCRHTAGCLAGSAWPTTSAPHVTAPSHPSGTLAGYR